MISTIKKHLEKNNLTEIVIKILCLPSVQSWISLMISMLTRGTLQQHLTLTTPLSHLLLNAKLPGTKKQLLNYHNMTIGWINLILCFLPDWESLAHRNSCLPGMPRIVLCLLFVFVFVFSNLNFILHLEKTFLAAVITPVIWNLLLVSYLLKICGQMPVTLSNLDSV